MGGRSQEIQPEMVFQFWLAAEQDLVEAKGRIKEAAGMLTGNDELRAEGKTDQAIGQVKQVAEKAIDKVEQAVKKVRE